MQNLEDMLRDVVKAGELSHLSLVPSQNGKSFRTSYAMCSKFGITFAEDPDPVKSIMLAISTAKIKKPPAPRRPATVDVVAERIADEPAADHTGVALADDPLADLM